LLFPWFRSFGSPSPRLSEPLSLFRESEFGEPRYELEYEESDIVRIGFGGVVFRIKAVILEEGSYL
jgi:hypothetical protein